MKFFKSLTNLVLYFLLCVSIESCIEKDDLVEPKPDPEPTPVEKEYELADNVIELEGDLLKHVTSLKGDTLVYNSNTPGDALPEVGEIVIVTQPTDVFPYGFLGKVTKISNDGNINVITEPAALDEAFVYLDVSQSYELTPESSKAISRNAETQTEFKKFTRPFSKEFSDVVSLNGGLTLGVKVDATLKIDKRNGKKLRNGKITISTLQEVNMSLDVELEKEFEESVNFPPKAITFPPLQFGPVTLVPALQPYLFIQAEGKIETHPSMFYQQVRTASLVFDGNSWSYINDDSNDPTVEFNLTPDISMQGSIYDGVGVALEFRLYGSEDNKAFIDAKIGPQISGEVTLATDPNSIYESGKDSNLDFGMLFTAGGGAGVKFFFIEKEWSHYPINLSFLQSTRHFFPSFSNHSLAYANGGISASTNLGRNLLWKQNVGLALYKGDERIEVSEPVEYKFENDFKERNPLEGIFEDIPEEEKNDYSIWSYVKWGDLFIKCSNLSNGNIEAVDLGLSVKWASCNIGAHKPEDYGNYFAFGEVTPKSPSWKNWNNPMTLKLWGDNDAAHVIWGKQWRMPTKADCEELLKECTWQLVNRGVIKGYEVTGPNGNSIFLPLTGRYGGDTQNYEARYRTSDAEMLNGDSYDDYSTIIMELQKNFEDTEIDYVGGASGHPIRPVEINLIGKWIREDCQCDSLCHYKFEADSTGYYSESHDGNVYKSSFTWSFDGKFLKLTRNKTDNSDDGGVDISKIIFQSGGRFAEYGSDNNFEETELNTTYFYRSKE